MALMRTVCLVNRTKVALTCTFDGQTIPIEPGENHGFPLVAVRFAKQQNPVMGSEHPYNPMKFDSLVGVKGVDDCRSIKQSNAVERIDRSKMRGIGRGGREMEGDPATPFEARVAGRDGIDNQSDVSNGPSGAGAGE